MEGIVLFVAISLIHCVTTASEAPTLDDRIDVLQKEIKSLKSKSVVEISPRKIRKHIRREMKNKLLPKLQKSLNEIIDKSVRKKVDERVADAFKASAVDSTARLTMLTDLQRRMNDLVDENIKLKNALQLNSQKTTAKLENLQTSLRRNCNCEIVLKDSVLFDGSTPTFAIQKVIHGDHAEDFDVGLLYPIVDNVPQEQVPERHPETFKDDMTFNVSLDVQDFLDEDSLLLVTEEGHMTRVALSDTSTVGMMRAAPFVEGVAYDSVSRRIFWGSNRNQRKAIYSVNLDGSKLTKLQDGRWVFSLAVDGRRRKVFMSDWALRVISVMHVNGNNYKILTDYKEDGDPRNIALDTRRRLIYVSYTFAIVRMKYDGSRIRRMTGGVWMQPLALDVADNILYYSIKKNIYKLDLSTSNSTSKFVNQMDSDLSYLSFHENNLYISYQSWIRSVDVLNLKDNVLKEFIDLEATSLLRMCVIST